MSERHTKSTHQSHALWMRRWMLQSIPWLISLFVAGWLGCVPAGYSIQIHNVTNASSANLSRGLVDVELASAYNMRVEMANWLTMTSQPDLFTSETNYVELSYAKVWFKYPEGFTLLASSADALYQQSNPRKETVFGRMNPTLQASISPGLTSGGGGATVGNLFGVAFTAAPSETLALWSKAPELEGDPNQCKFRAFTVTVNIKIYGKTGTGGEVSSQEIQFPIVVCKGCRNKALYGKTCDFSACQGSASSTTGDVWTGQENSCSEAKQEGQP